MSEPNPLDRLNTEGERLLREYRRRFKDDPPFFLYQGAELLEKVKDALETNTPIPFEVPEDGFACSDRRRN